MSRYQQYQSTIDNMSSGNADKNYNTSSSATAHIAGRSVTITQFNGSISKEARLYQNYVNSTKKDRICSNYVNTVKQIESDIRFKNFTPPKNV